MWGKWGKMAAIAILGLSASIVCIDAAWGDRTRNYTPQEMRSVLRGFGYNVTIGDNLSDSATIAAIRQFQQGYKLTVDGTPGLGTQNLAANLVMILQGNLNLVVKPNPPLPRSQFYGPQTEAAVRQFQRQFSLPVTGIANLQVRQRLDEEAKKILTQPNATPTPAVTPSSTASPSPRPIATPPAVTPSPRPTATPKPKPSSSP